MAANKNLDPATCTTAAEAFKYPLPQVRQFHRTLTTDLDEKNARLRILVGGSYRQLLGTAEMILEMRENIDVVEDKLGRVGKGCGRNVVGELATGLGKLQETRGPGRSKKEMEWAAKTKVLAMCGVTIGRLLKRGSIMDAGAKIGRAKNLVLAAKVYILSRLLAKSTGDMAAGRSKADQETVEEAKRKFANLRRKLLRAIDKTLERTDGDPTREDIIQALSAYSLATSSGAKDVLRHFLSIRGEALALTFEDEEKTSPGVIRALELYTRSLLDVQALVPRRLSEALAGLKSKALLRDGALRELETLRLDVCDSWFGDEILFFTPYIRHDDLGGLLAIEKLRGWAKKASEVLLQGFSKSLQLIQEFKSAVDLRTEILQVWIKDGGRAKGFDPSIVLDGLREVVNNRMVQLLESRIKKLHLVTTDVEETLGSWRNNTPDSHGNLWDEDMLDMELSNGAALFKQTVIARTHGRNDGVSRVFEGYQAWRQLVDEIIVVIDQLKKQRWDDDLEDLEDDDTLESRNILLSTDDPRMLRENLESGLEKAYKDLHEKLASLLTTYADSDDISQMSIYVLRIIRDIRSELPNNKSLQAFGLSLIPTLHERLASTVSEGPVETFSKSFDRNKVAGRALWEGNPELPVQPSPATFKFLNSLTTGMTSLGDDLWSKKAIIVLKKDIREELGKTWSDSLKAQQERNFARANKTATNGTAGSDEATEGKTEAPTVPPENSFEVDLSKRKEVLIQSYFDVLLLENSLEISDGDSDELKSLAELLKAQLDLDAPSQKRLLQGAKEFWKRTSLLFGLLA